MNKLALVLASAALGAAAAFAAGACGEDRGSVEVEGGTTGGGTAVTGATTGTTSTGATPGTTSTSP